MTIKFNDLKFETHSNCEFGTQAKISFPNGYGASIITGRAAYTDDEHPYELAVIKDGSICYSSPLTDDVIGHLTESGVEDVLNKIKELPKEDEDAKS